MSSGFISEADIAERKRARNEYWKNNRKDDDPEEPPEEPETLRDNRTLYERLQEQKDKKNEDWEEAHKLKNMVRGLEDEEVDFLDLVDTTKLNEEKRIKKEEDSALKEYRKKVSEMQQKVMESEVLSDLKAEVKKTSVTPKQKPKSQLSLLMGAIKRKSTESEESSAKKVRLSSTETESSPTEKSDSSSAVASNTIENNKKVQDECGTSSKTDEETALVDKNDSLSESPSPPKAMKCVAILPGMGNYTDSSEESTSDSDVEITPRSQQYRTDITGRVIRIPGDHDGCH